MTDRHWLRGVTAAAAAPQFPGDPDFPYVGKFIANLTLAQLRTIDCGSKRQYGYREYCTVIRGREQMLNGSGYYVIQRCS